MAGRGSVSTVVKESKRVFFALFHFPLPIFCNYSSKDCRHISGKSKVLMIAGYLGKANLHFFEKLILCPLSNTKLQSTVTSLVNQAKQIEFEVINTCHNVLWNMLTTENYLQRISSIN